MCDSSREPRGHPWLCQPVPAEQWVLPPTHVSLEAQSLGQRTGSPHFPMWISSSHISLVPSSPEPPSSSLSPETTHIYFGGGASLEIKSHPRAALDGTGPALGHPSVSPGDQEIPSGNVSQGFAATSGFTLLRLTGCS